MNSKQTSASSLVAAVDVGGTTLKGALFDDTGLVVSRRTRGTFDSDGDALRGILDLLDELSEDAERQGSSFDAIGIAVPGLIDGGTVTYAANLGFSMLPLEQILTDRFHVEVTVEHDARAGALAELIAAREASPRLDDLLFVPIGTGIGAAIVSDGRVIRGRAGAAGEFGHQVVVPDGEACGCGQRGCVEVYASATRILSRYRAADGQTATTTEEIVARLDIDPIARLVWSDAVDALADGIASTTALLDPELVVIGGGLSGAGDSLIRPLHAAVAERLTWRSAPGIVVSTIGADAGLIGAALAVAPSLRTPQFVRRVGENLLAEKHIRQREREHHA